MKKMNMYFFGEEEISLSDFVWFYCLLPGAALILLIVVLIIEIQLAFM